MGVRGAQALDRNPNWKGGRSVASSGYVLVKRPGHHAADCRGYVYEHRLVAEEKLGRQLQPGEQVHHVNGAKDDNRPENIEVHPSRLSHGERHRRVRLDRRRDGEANPVIACACGCGETFQKFDRGGRPRRFVSGHNTAARNRGGVMGSRG